jgi:putative DNA primase/helicase
MSARAIVKSLGGMWCGSYGLARCPSHDDRKPSLKIRDDKSKHDGILL